MYREKEPKILFDQTKKINCLYPKQKNVLTHFKKIPYYSGMLLFEKKQNIFSIFEPSMLLWKSLHFTKKKNPKTRMSKFLSGLKDFLNKRVLRFMLFSLLFKKNTTLWLPGFFLVCVYRKKISTKKFFCPDKEKKYYWNFFPEKLSKPKKVSN